MRDYRAELLELTKQQTEEFNREPPDPVKREELHKKIVRVQEDRAKEGRAVKQ